MDIDTFVDKALWKKSKVTYTEVHKFGLISKDVCLEYAKARWGDLGSSRIVNGRSNKLWKICKESLYVRHVDSVPNSLWKICWLSWSGKRSISHEGYKSNFLENWQPEVYDTFDVLGYVIADNHVQARMKASITLGPRAHDEANISITRIGISSQEEIDKLNFDLKEKYKVLISRAKQTIMTKEWEIEQAQCQIDFLEMSQVIE